MDWWTNHSGKTSYNHPTMCYTWVHRLLLRFCMCWQHSRVSALLVMDMHNWIGDIILAADDQFHVNILW
jgi:hypothetical protein